MDRTGAPMQLMTLLPGLAEALGARITLLQGAEGPLTREAAAHVHRVVGEPPHLRALARVASRAPAVVRRPLDWLWAVAMRRLVGAVDVVYVNSLISRRLASPFLSWPLVVHVHELAEAARGVGEPARELVRSGQLVLVPSPAAKGWVVGSGVAEDRVAVLPGAVAPRSFEAPSGEQVEALRSSLGVPPGHAVVATVGWVGHMKGSDRFLDVASGLRDRGAPPAHLVWVGAGAATTEERRFREAIQHRGLADQVTVLPVQHDLRPLYALADVVLVTSRAESLSLVALEGAAQGTPVVCFPGAGGPDGLAEEGVVSQPASADVEDVVALLTELLEAPAERRARGAHARRVVVARHGAGAAQGQLVEALAATAGWGRG
jgi:glycosyltransferase involved in cell wall biosynthesis